jgi:hypothetical protein
MSGDDDQERQLDVQLRALARRVAEGAPPPVPFEALAAHGRPSRRRRAPLVIAAAVVAALAAVIGIVATRDRGTPIESSPLGEPIELDARGATTLQLGPRPLAALGFTLPDGAQLTVAATPTELCAQLASATTTTACKAGPEGGVRYTSLVLVPSAVVVTVVPAGSTRVEIAVAGAHFSPAPVDGVVAFTVDALSTPFTITAYDASGRRTGTASSS